MCECLPVNRRQQVELGGSRPSDHHVAGPRNQHVRCHRRRPHDASHDEARTHGHGNDCNGQYCTMIAQPRKMVQRVCRDGSRQSHCEQWRDPEGPDRSTIRAFGRPYPSDRGRTYQPAHTVDRKPALCLRLTPRPRPKRSGPLTPRRSASDRVSNQGLLSAPVPSKAWVALAARARVSGVKRLDHRRRREVGT